MGYYLQFDEGDPLPLASNIGWGDIFRVLDSLPPKKYKTLNHLATYGWTENIASLTAECEKLMEADGVSDDVMDTLDNLHQMLEKHEGSVVVQVTDGLTDKEQDNVE